ncbi:hypothetical protein [Nocardia sp. R7R-8]|uniref:hypothetical protein n=1 Tax=Nocardia sp. R7R-8 TaxID=3459304 RepID=UPI00403D83B2
MKDTSRAGAYHNGRYKQIAEEIGLTVERTPPVRLGNTTLAKATSDAYRVNSRPLAAALVAHRLHETGQTTGADAADENDDDTRRGKVQDVHTQPQHEKPEHPGESGGTTTIVRCDHVAIMGRRALCPGLWSRCPVLFGRGRPRRRPAQ